MGREFPFPSTPEPLLLSSGTSQEKDSSFIWPSLPSSRSLLYSLCLSFLPLFHFRRSQASRWGSFYHAWWVCGTWGGRARKGKEIAHQLQQGGRSECGDAGGGRQEDAGETRQGQRHHLRPHRHEHGERGEEKRRKEKDPLENIWHWSLKDKYKLCIALFLLTVLENSLCWTHHQSSTMFVIIFHEWFNEQYHNLLLER